MQLVVQTLAMKRNGLLLKSSAGNKIYNKISDNSVRYSDRWQGKRK